MSAFRDTWIMAKRSLRHTIRSMDTIITVAITPIAMLLMFVFIFGGAFESLVPGNYIDYITPGIAVITVVSGIAYAAYRLNNDLTKGIINRFKTMPISPSAILNGHVVSAVVSNLVSVALVMSVAALVGFRPAAGPLEWLLFTTILVLFTTAMSWLAMIFGLIAKTAEGSGAFSYILMFMVLLSSAFTPTDKMSDAVRAFAEHQPMTPIIETLRSLMVNGTAGDSAGLAVAWCGGLLIVAYAIALWVYRKKTI
jgi:ABC-2 type transport system permease protein